MIYLIKGNRSLLTLSPIALYDIVKKMKKFSDGEANEYVALCDANPNEVHDYEAQARQIRSAVRSHNIAFASLQVQPEDVAVPKSSAHVLVCCCCVFDFALAYVVVLLILCITYHMFL